MTRVEDYAYDPRERGHPEDRCEDCGFHLTDDQFGLCSDCHASRIEEWMAEKREAEEMARCACRGDDPGCGHSVCGLRCPVHG